MIKMEVTKGESDLISAIRSRNTPMLRWVYMHTNNFGSHNVNDQCFSECHAFLNNIIEERKKE